MIKLRNKNEEFKTRLKGVDRNIFGNINHRKQKSIKKID